MPPCDVGSLNLYEHYLYPYKKGAEAQIQGKVEDLNLTQIVKAFIGKEYSSWKEVKNDQKRI